MFKLNNADNYEALAPFKLTKEQFPIAWNAKVEELMEECNMTREEAEDVVKDITFELEIYYEKGTGLFAVESEAVESGFIASPYTQDVGMDADEN